MIKKLLIFLLLTAFSFSQKKEGQAIVDSLLLKLPKLNENKNKVDLLNELAVSYRKINNEEVENYATQALNLAKKIKYTDGIAYGYRNLGIAQTAKADFANALINYENGLKTTKNKKIKGQILGSIGRVYSLKGDYTKMLDFSMQSLALFEEGNDVKLQAVALSNVASAYLSLGDKEKYREYYKKSTEVLNNKVIVSTSKPVCPIIPKNINVNYYKKQINKAEKLGYTSEKASLTIAECKILINTKDYKKALEKINSTLISFENKNDFYNETGSLMVKNDVLLQLAKTEKNLDQKNTLLIESLQCIKTAVALSEKNNLIENTYYGLKRQCEILEYIGDFKSAFDVQKKVLIYRDSIFNTKTKETVKNIEDKREIQLRDKQIKIDKLSLEVKEKQKWYLFGGIGLLTIIGGLLFYQSRKRKTTNQKLEVLNQKLDQANKNKTQFFSILNHDLRSPVSNLISFLHLQKNNPELLTEERKNRLQNQTISGAENLLNSMEDILLWSKGQMENFKPQFKNIFVDKLFNATNAHFASEENVKIIFENLQNIQIFSDENYLKTIIRNLTGNAIKALNKIENPTIIWKAWQENNFNFLSITDNGKGASDIQFKALYDDTEVVGINSGLGLHLIRDLAKAINCEIVVTSKINEGTTFVLKLK